MELRICSAWNFRFKYSAFIAGLIIILLNTRCKDQGELLTIYSAELRNIENSGSLEDIRVELWRSRRNGSDQLVQTTHTNIGGRFEFAFFSVSGSHHYARINAVENFETNCKINVMLQEGKRVNEIKLCKRSDYLLNLSLSEESKSLPISRISILVRNEDCPVDLEAFSSTDIDNFSQFFEVFPDSKYGVSFSFYDDLNQRIHTGNVVVEIKNAVVEIKL